MAEQSRDWTVEFYVDIRGRSPVEDFVDSLQESEQAKVYNSLRLLREFGVQIEMPHARPLRGHSPLWELRPFPNRLIYFAHRGRRLIVLHGFRKQSRKTPQQEIQIAERRMEEFLRRQE